MEKKYELPKQLRSCVRWACCVSRTEETTDVDHFNEAVQHARAYAEDTNNSLDHDVACVDVEDLGWCKILRSRNAYGDWSPPYFLMTGWPTADQVREFFDSRPNIINFWRRDQVLARINQK